jgi:uncharacterized protein with HEPN domain
MSDNKQRLLQLLELVDKEVLHLQQVQQRFFAQNTTIDLVWLNSKLNTPEGIDQLESFTAKFSRLQDTLGDKVLPLFLKITAEPIGTAIENLNRAEKLGLITSVSQWLNARQLRNLLIHEYINDLAVLLEALQQAKLMSDLLINSAAQFNNYVNKLTIEIL